MSPEISAFRTPRPTRTGYYLSTFSTVLLRCISQGQQARIHYLPSLAWLLLLQNALEALARSLSAKLDLVARKPDLSTPRVQWTNFNAQLSILDSPFPDCELFQCEHLECAVTHILLGPVLPHVLNLHA